jgi:hypothetical protein
VLLVENAPVLKFPDSVVVETLLDRFEFVLVANPRDVELAPPVVMMLPFNVALFVAIDDAPLVDRTGSVTVGVYVIMMMPAEPLPPVLPLAVPAPPPPAP